MAQIIFWILCFVLPARSSWWFDSGSDEMDEVRIINQALLLETRVHFDRILSALKLFRIHIYFQHESASITDKVSEIKSLYLLLCHSNLSEIPGYQKIKDMEYLAAEIDRTFIVNSRSKINLHRSRRLASQAITEIDRFPHLASSAYPPSVLWILIQALRNCTE